MRRKKTEVFRNNFQGRKVQWDRAKIHIQGTDVQDAYEDRQVCVNVPPRLRDLGKRITTFLLKSGQT
jgi:hypothetical protein